MDKNVKEFVENLHTTWVEPLILKIYMFNEFLSIKLQHCRHSEISNEKHISF